jgi:phosphohistidine phosphatase SixA
MHRRELLILVAAGVLAGRPVLAQDEDLLARLRRGSLVLLMRHALTVPSTGDPPGFRLDDCATQRNLGEPGRAQARRIGQRLRDLRVPIGTLRTSAWCRCRETADLLDLGPAEHLQPLDSFFEDRRRREAHREGMLAFIRTWQGPGNALLVTHQVNVTAVTGVFPRSGEIVVVTAASEPVVLGQLQLA